MSELITCKDLTKRFGNHTALDHLNLSLDSGKIIGLLGPNGSGKTTLLKKISEELLQRKDIHAEYMPQNYEELLSAFRMTGNILMRYVIRYTG